MTRPTVDPNHLTEYDWPQVADHINNKLSDVAEAVATIVTTGYNTVQTAHQQSLSWISQAYHQVHNVTADWANTTASWAQWIKESHNDTFNVTWIPDDFDVPTNSTDDLVDKPVPPSAFLIIFVAAMIFLGLTTIFCLLSKVMNWYCMNNRSSYSLPDQDWPPFGDFYFSHDSGINTDNNSTVEGDVELGEQDIGANAAAEAIPVPNDRPDSVDEVARSGPKICPTVQPKPVLSLGQIRMAIRMCYLASIEFSTLNVMNDRPGRKRENKERAALRLLATRTIMGDFLSAAEEYRAMVAELMMQQRRYLTENDTTIEMLGLKHYPAVLANLKQTLLESMRSVMLTVYDELTFRVHTQEITIAELDSELYKLLDAYLVTSSVSVRELAILKNKRTMAVEAKLQKLADRQDCTAVGLSVLIQEIVELIERGHSNAVEDSDHEYPDLDVEAVEQDARSEHEQEEQVADEQANRAAVPEEDGPRNEEREMEVLI